MDWIIPLLMIEQVPRSQRAAVAEQLLPAALPGFGFPGVLRSPPSPPSSKSTAGSASTGT